MQGEREELLESLSWVDESRQNLMHKGLALERSWSHLYSNELKAEYVSQMLLGPAGLWNDFLLLLLVSEK